MAISVMARGNTAMAAGSPGVLASKEVTVSGMTGGETVIVTLSHDESQTLQRNPAAQYTLQVVKAAGKFTVYPNQKQTPGLYFDYAVLTGTA